MAKESRNDKRVARHQRIRKNVYGTPEKPRLCVFRSSKNISVQIIDDVNGVTLASASTVDKELKSQSRIRRQQGSCQGSRRSYCEESTGQGYRRGYL